MSLEGLRSGLGAATLDTGGRISAGEYRRLACNATIIPAVLGTRSVPLDLGDKARLFSELQRTAMAVRDKGCTADGCDRPPAWCEAHHDEAWADGGKTDIKKGRLLCPFHHHRAHDSRYAMVHIAGGRVRFHKRT